LALGAVDFAVQGIAFDVADELVHGQGVGAMGVVLGVALAVVDLVSAGRFR